MDDYSQYLVTVEQARHKADALLAVISPSHQPANEAIAKTWEMLFDFLAQPRETDSALDDINTTAGVIYKLIQGAEHLKALEHKIREFEEERARINAESRPPGLTPEICELIERKMGLLD